jgi:hypothetical protein
MSIFNNVSVNGKLNANDNPITTSYIPLDDSDVCNKKYVDQQNLQNIYNKSIPPEISLTLDNPLTIKNDTDTILSVNNTNVSIAALTSPNAVLLSDKPIESPSFKITNGTDQQYLLADGSTKNISTTKACISFSGFTLHNNNLDKAYMLNFSQFAFSTESVICSISNTEFITTSAFNIFAAFRAYSGLTLVGFTCYWTGGISSIELFYGNSNASPASGVVINPISLGTSNINGLYVSLQSPVQLPSDSFTYIFFKNLVSNNSSGLLQCLLWYV